MTKKKPKATGKAKKNNGGRPTKFKEEYIKQVYEACSRLGAIDRDLAAVLGVSEKTLNTWKLKYPKFLQSIRDGKDIYDTNTVEISLRDRATGYSHDEEKIFCSDGQVIRAPTTKHYPPETSAMIFWLKNRNSDRWKDKQETEISGSLDLNNATREELEAELAALKRDD